MGKYDSWAYGLCECRDGCICEAEPGPAILIVRREDKELKVCTKCYLLEDAQVKLLLKREDKVGELMSYDAFGLAVFALQVRDKEMN